MSMRLATWFLLFFLISSSKTTNIDDDSNDDIELTSDMPNVCSKVEIRTVTKLIPCLKSYDHLVKVWSRNCSNGRRICPTYEHRTEYYRSEQTVTAEVNVTIYHCCLGWTRLIQDYGCPIAMQPNRVQRKIPLRHANSHQLDSIHNRCPHNRFGMHCEYSCAQCVFGTCNWRVRTCDCQSGITGLFCNQTKMGEENIVDEAHRCQLCHKGNTASCHMETGKCQCLPGHQGIRCEEDCPINYYGHDCINRCICQNGGICDSRDGHCFCLSGFTGGRCESSCSPGTFGHMCLQKCQCTGDNICHPRTGECHSSSCNGDSKCLLEQQRKKSLISSCPEGYYGAPSCRQKCMCMNNAQCESTSGRCLCHSGHAGRYCERSCERGWYGPGCIHRCNCHNGATCDARTGVCLCGIGVTGILCDQECPEGTYGRNCSDICQCKNSARCNRITGCCSCPIGYYGSTCQFECRPFTHGFYCSQTCNCSIERSDSCDSKTGKCRCKSGFYGDQCETACPLGRWGDQCLNKCDCDGNSCDSKSGICQCPAGRTGIRCEDDCPTNTFGVGCKLCSCHSFQLCDSVTGECRCPSGWKGDACQFPITANGPDIPERGDMYKKDT
ncbi:unnamed protein product [Rotaria socialis]|uniref:Uncharacterized protein n=2 Tax=Rotaria socialis TaxID=392032 RepID=A0A817VUK8_9BILA|nr:unnamed protein product [Rotaria socialis]CAF3347756.1 unnamed protein product [Rotaria socialis]CAF3351516.1 unnamed protein product [Rotaria socialis]CAF3443956.1 unnamed protein product [Rotaria socialis]CAF3564126.1 unnamed protein product [Rotaria socialis]